VRIVNERTRTGSVTLYDLEPTPDRLCDDVARGLALRPRKLPPKYFYDDRGSRLFERITQLHAYYPTRTEIGILRDRAAEIAERIGPDARLVEFGSGSGDKTWILLRHLEAPSAYVPVDISRAQLVEFALEIAAAFPELRVVPVCADYTTSFPLPPLTDDTGRSVAFFPGSTLGNFEPGEAEVFLRRVRNLVGPEGGFLIGLDLRKDRRIIETAYDDPEGLTAEFNLNLLARINRECGADFDLRHFEHYAFFDEQESRVEMRLVSTRAQAVRLRPDSGGSQLVQTHFQPGDYITTEYSYKYDLDEFAVFARHADWSVVASWTDPDGWFAVVLME
jgi:dimethylhistidine N-methyltransferase